MKFSDVTDSVTQHMHKTGSGRYHVMALSLLERVKRDIILPYAQKGRKNGPGADAQPGLKALRQKNPSLLSDVTGFCFTDRSGHDGGGHYPGMRTLQAFFYGHSSWSFRTGTNQQGR